MNRRKARQPQRIAACLAHRFVKRLKFYGVDFLMFLGGPTKSTKSRKFSRQETPNSVKTKCTVCVTTLCEHSMCEHSMCEHSMRDHSMREHSMREHSMCEHPM